MIGLEAEWRDLALTSPTATIFQTYEWNSTWWRYFGKSPGRKLLIFCFRTNEGALVGLAPMMTEPFYLSPIRRIAFLGGGVSDYLDIIHAPGYDSDVAESFYETLESYSGWDMLDLQQLRASSMLVPRIPQSKMLKLEDHPGEPCPFIDLPASWEQFLMSLGKKTRSNVSYYDRALSKVYNVQYEAVCDDDVLADEMEHLFNLHQRRWNKRWLPGVFGSKKIREFHREVATLLMHKGWLRLFVLRLDGETQAVLYCFTYASRTCYYQGGFEPTLAKLSLGTVLTARAIRHCIEEGNQVFDFLRGDEPYKAKWTSESVVNTRRIVTRHGATSDTVVRYAQSLQEKIEFRAKEWARARR